MKLIKVSSTFQGGVALIKKTIAISLILALFLPQTVALSQQQENHSADQEMPSQGERVRVHLVDGTMVTGILQSFSEQDVRVLNVVRGRDVVIPIPLRQVELMERSVGRYRKFVRNFFITFAALSITMGTVSAISWSPCTEQGDFACFLHPESRREALAEGLGAGAIGGVWIGVLVGLAVKHDRWEPVSLPGPE